LQVLFDAVLFKDIVKRHHIRFGSSLENLATWLISNISNDFSYNTLTKQTQISSVHTIQKYIGYLEEAFIFFTVPRFSFKVGEQQKSNKKIYCYDNGFYKAKAFQFTNDYGKLLENIIAIKLKKRSLKDGSHLYYWNSREREEVDFIIQEGLKITRLIQVCWSVEQNKTNEREVRALLKASKELGCTRLIVITNNHEALEHVSWFGIEEEIEYIPARKWLLEGFESI
jgi:predicted AAA+ superfamily ATPase